MYLDATYLHVRNSTSQVVSMAVVVATGITADGGREVLGLDVGDSEDDVFWRSFLTALKRRGLVGVRLVISDQHAGLVAGLQRSFQGTAHQRCRVHFARNLLALVPKTHTDMVAAVFRTVFAQPDPKAVPRPGTRSATSSLHASRRSAPDGRRENRGPGVHRVPPGALAQNLEHQPTRTRQQGNQAPIPGRGHLPQRRRGDPACRAILADMHDEWQSGERRYLSEGSMAQLKQTSNTDPIAAIDHSQ